MDVYTILTLYVPAFLNENVKSAYFAFLSKSLVICTDKSSFLIGRIKKCRLKILESTKKNMKITLHDDEIVG